MAKQLRSRDVSEAPELLRLAEEVSASRSPLLLTRGDVAIAVLTPVTPASTRRPTRPRRGPDSSPDSLLNIIGIADAGEPTDIALHKHEYLAEAYEPRDS